MNITVLGAGLIGRAIIQDLARDERFQLTAIDINQKLLNEIRVSTAVKTIQADLGESGAVARLVQDAELVVCAVPGFMGFETLKKVIEAKKNVVDISFFAEDAFLLDDLAKANDVTAVVDCGVAPGLCNILAGHIDAELAGLERYLCYVGGLPRERNWPYEYKVVFSPVDVLEEYTRPARIVEYGQEISKPALSGLELLDFPGIGSLEAFNTDGLRSLLKTIKAPFMKEKTLRYPGHAELMRVFRESGFFSHQTLTINGQTVKPLELSSKLLFKQWQLKPGEEDLTIMRVIMEGKKDGQRYRYTYELLDHYDKASQTTSMARTTGYTCSLVARQLAAAMIAQKGIVPPEYIGRSQTCYEHLLSGYEQRDIQLSETMSRL